MVRFRKAKQSMETEKFACDRCGKHFPKEDITYIACEGLFCRVCTENIYEKMVYNWSEESC